MGDSVQGVEGVAVSEENGRAVEVYQMDLAQCRRTNNQCEIYDGGYSVAQYSSRVWPRPRFSSRIWENADLSLLLYRVARVAATFIRQRDRTGEHPGTFCT
jgi:hypothetical protein